MSRLAQAGLRLYQIEVTNYDILSNVELLTNLRNQNDQKSIVCCAMFGAAGRWSKASCMIGISCDG